MENKIYLYSGIYDWNVEEILNKMEAFGDDSDILFRLNSGGGNVFSAQGWLFDMKKRKGKNNCSIEGNASSMAFMLSLHMDNVTALETSKALIHRAYMWVENAEETKMLADVNEQFKEVIRARLNVPALEERLGMSLDAFFYAGEKNEVRHEAWLNASDLVAIGLVKQEDIIQITPERIAADNKVSAIFDNYREPIIASTDKPTEITNKLEINNNILEMEKSEQEAAVQAAREQEKARIDAWMVFADVDLAKVRAGIDSGKDISAKEMGEFLLLRADATSLKNIEAANPPAVDTPESVEAAYSKEKEEAEKALFAQLGISDKQ